MSLLEEIYREGVKKTALHERKVELHADTNTILTGPRRCGKSYLIFGLLQQLRKERYLYIDLNDFRYAGKISARLIDEFVEHRPVELVVVENISSKFELHCKAVKIFSSVSPIQKEGFTTLLLGGLDFEEYAAFQARELFKKNDDDAFSQIFTHYLKDGVLPEKIHLSDFQKIQRAQELVRLIANDPVKELLIIFFAEKMGLKLSNLQIYTQLRAQHKLSKDKLYRCVDELCNDGVLKLVGKLGQSNAAKKCFLYDFAFVSALCDKKEFSRSFEAMVYLQLAQTTGDLFYTDEFELYSPKEQKAFISLPFFDEEQLKQKLAKKLQKPLGYTLQRVDIVTVSADFTFELFGIVIEAAPFWQWAMRQ